MTLPKNACLPVIHSGNGSHARVLVTRAAHQGSELAERLRVLGLEPVLIPAIETVEPASFADLDAASAQLERFDWLLFTSANAVEAFGRRRAAAGNPEHPSSLASSLMASSSRDQEFPAHLRIAAIGPTTARALEKIGLQPSLIPSQAVAESLTAALLPHAHQADGRAARFLLIRAEEARAHLPDTLCAAGAEVTIAPAYRTIVPQNSVNLFRELFTDPLRHPAAITFTSSSTARNLLALCEAAHVKPPAAALRISIGPITSATMRELGWPPHAEAPEATIASLAETAVSALLSPPQG